MDGTLKSAIEHKDTLQVLNCIEDRMDVLSKVWNGTENHKNVECA